MGMVVKILILSLASLFLFSPVYGQELAAPVTPCDKLYVIENDTDSVITEQTMPFDLEAAYKACKQAVSKYPEEARLWLRLSYLAQQKGNETETVSALNKAAEYGSKVGLLVAYTYHKAEGTPHVVLKWLKVLSEKYDAYKLILANALIEGFYEEHDPKKGLKILTELYQQGNMDSVIVLGRVYYEGKFVEKDLLKAFYLFETAVERGHPQSHFYLGQFYLGGMGVDQDEKLGLSLMHKSYELGWEDASLHLGLHYWKNKEKIKAEKWFCKTESGKRVVDAEPKLSCDKIKGE